MFFNSPVQKGGKEAEKQEKRNHTLDPLPLLREMKEHSLVVSFLFLVVVVVVFLFCFVLCFFFFDKGNLPSNLSGFLFRQQSTYCSILFSTHINFLKEMLLHLWDLG